MARVHENVMQASELIFVDSSSSFDDFNNPMFVLSTSSAAGGLPLGIVLTSGESANIVHEAMSTLSELFPKCAFFGKGSPSNIITDDSMAERDGLQRTWPKSTLYLCIFHFLQTMWRWLWNSNNKIQKDDRQYLMKLIRRLVYATTIDNLEKEYTAFKANVVVAQYANLLQYVGGYWTRRKEWAVCFRDQAALRGTNTNNYAESGIRILKDIVFRRVKAYNLVQLFQFITHTFETCYERRLLAVANNRVDRYVSLRFKGLGASLVKDCDMQQSSPGHTYNVVSSTNRSIKYDVDTMKWNCSCTVGRTGYPSGEPCKHQAAIAKKYRLVAPNILPYFNSEGRYLHAVLAVGREKAGEKSFYYHLGDEDNTCIKHVSGNESKAEVTIHEEIDDEIDTQSDEGGENLDLLLGMIDEQDKLKQEVNELSDMFFTDVQKRISETDKQYLEGLKKFFSTYMNTVDRIEPNTSGTPQLASLLHTYFKTTPPNLKISGTRRMGVQPTALSRRREGIARGSQRAPSGRPPKRSLKDPDCHIQVKRGRQDHTKRKQNLILNERKNQPNHFKHGKGH